MAKDTILDTLSSIKEGVIRPQAAKILQCSERTLQKWMNYYGISLRDYKPKREKRAGWGANKLNKTAAKQIRVEFFGDIKTVVELAEEYKVTIASIYRILSNRTYIEVSAKISGIAQVNVEHNPMLSI